MKVGIIATGNMGRAVGVRLAQLGHNVFFGARNLDRARQASDLAGNGSQIGSIHDAALFGDILFWTLRDPQPANILDDPAILDGKILIDLNNRDYAKDVHSGAWFGTAIAEELQRNLPKAHVVKALNTLAMESFDISPEELRAAGAQTFLAGASTAAKQQVALLVQSLGFESVDLGSTPAAFRAAEALGDVIRLLMIDGKRGGQAHLKLITLPKPTLDSIGTRSSSNYA